MASSERSRVTQITDGIYLRMRHPDAWSSATAEPLGGEPGFQSLGGHKYCLLTTFRKNGQPVPTPVWFGLAGGRAYLHSGAAAGKVKRIAANPRVRLAPCDARGKPLGAPVEGDARVLASGEEQQAERAIAANYGLGRRVYERVVGLFSRAKTVYIEVVPARARARAQAIPMERPPEGAGGPATMSILEIGGRRLPFLRWSVVRMVLGARNLTRNWQVGDGREEALAAYVATHARPRDIDDAIRVIDEFCRTRSIMMNVGDEKGEILDRAVRRAQPSLLLELGAYCGYSGLRMARVMGPGARLCSVECSPENAAIARRNWTHAGAGQRLNVLVGTLDDGGRTIGRLREEFGFGEGKLDFVFLDHDKNAYLPDLERIVHEGWLHRGSVVVADNVGFPGAPKYRAHLKAAEGGRWRTTEHATHLEYQSLLRDLVLESEYLGAPA